MAKMKDLNAALQKFQSTGKQGAFFSLANDKDSAVVRFLIGSELKAEKDWFIVHQVEIEGVKRWVQCSEEHDCPLCLSGNKPQLKLFLQLVDARDNLLKTWERGNTFIPKIQGLMNKYGDLWERKFEIERHGKKGDMKTIYEVYPLDKDTPNRDELPEKQNLLGTLILQKSHGEMRQMISGEPTEELKPRGREPRDVF